jgi:hypothetical protein
VRPVLTFALVGALAACGRPDARPAEPAKTAPAATLPPMAAGESLAARIERGRTSLVRRPGSTTAGDATSSWTAFLSGDRLVLVDDSTSLGDYGASRARFYFEEGRLRFYREEGTRVNMAPGATGSRSLEARIAFDETGAVAASAYREEGRDTTLPAPKADEARARAAGFLQRLMVP